MKLFSIVIFLLICSSILIEAKKKVKVEQLFVPKLHNVIRTSQEVPLDPPARKEWILSQSASALAHHIRTRKLTSVEVVGTFIEQAKLVNEKINAVTVWNEHALAEAAELDLQQATNRSIVGPLHGVPISVKDHIAVKGLVQSWCLNAFKDHIADEDAVAVARMKKAGAIVIAKTTMPPLGLSFDTSGPIFGITNNAYDQSRSAGGSSGGEGALIAARGSPLGIGSDVGGSLRIPAAWNGLCAIKPTQGRVPTTGSAFPPLGEIWEFMEHSNDCFTLGPMSRFVEDLELALSVMSGRDHRDYQAELPQWSSQAHKVDIRALRVATYLSDGVSTASSDVQRAVHHVAALLAEAGVQEITPLERIPLLSQGPGLLARLIAKNGCEKPLALLAQEPEITGAMLPLVELCPKLALATREEVDALHLELSQFRSEIAGVFKDYDLIIGPVNAIPAPKPEVTHSGESVALFSFTIALNVGQVPAVVVGPVLLGEESGEYSGLPVGVQLAFPKHDEHVGLAVARYLQGVIPMTGYAPSGFSQGHSHEHAHEDGVVHAHAHGHEDEGHQHAHGHAHAHVHEDGVVHANEHGHEDQEHQHAHDGHDEDAREVLN